jgi:hypothetical protein
MLHIKVSSDAWSTEFEITRMSFNGFLVNTISPHLVKFIDIEKTVISLPYNVTKFQRYNIHKLSIYPDFKGISYDGYNDQRYMEITLSKSYVQELFKDIPFHEPPLEIIAVPKSEKQIIFDNFMDFIQNNFQEEFKIFLNTNF